MEEENKNCINCGWFGLEDDLTDNRECPECNFEPMFIYSDSEWEHS